MKLKKICTVFKLGKNQNTNPSLKWTNLLKTLQIIKNNAFFHQLSYVLLAVNIKMDSSSSGPDKVESEKRKNPLPDPDDEEFDEDLDRELWASLEDLAKKRKK